MHCTIALFSLALVAPAVVVSQLTANQKQEAVDAHNALRRQTAKGNTVDAKGQAQPQAADMTEMIWDDQLAAETQAYADNCEFKHASSSERGGAGENIATGSAGHYSVTDFVNMWFSEITTNPGYMNCDVSKFENCSPPEGTVGHYTQVVWHNSYLLGCGLAKNCPASWGGASDILFCRYREPGNFGGYTMYTEGAPCSQCADGQGCNDGLCTGKPADQKKPAPTLDCGSVKDTDQYCDYYKGQGYCEDPMYQNWLLGVCAQTCFC
jgi:hypothetical protein